MKKIRVNVKNSKVIDGQLFIFDSTWMPGDGTYPGSDGYGPTDYPYIGDYSNPNAICDQYGCPHPEGIEINENNET